MFTKLGQVMLYVKDQQAARRFWTEKAGFQVIAEESSHGMHWIEIAPDQDSETTIVLHDKAAVEKMSPGVHLGTPSLMFYSHQLDVLYQDLTAKGVTVGEIVEMPSGRVFNFADDEGQYFAVMEK
ncbi:VOC family protein [Jeotgalibacillus haloalkalitolerans]|uniref:VOC family protein n=1 Tax=Jeotgalibacillus haloalkalitolerans TaxID=3104292 RepID=A0ABU5KNG9_9BACL|nr:VOC family protein [Jeotgalibacillus sp. HH7-29]MDZ5712805.1 VOC family protein [Jeotgalibacillus sp. HH7-29]